ncbi:tetratricopeptide repeat protein [Candidatus Palauibacter sp.]|uniref:tetratricopeptide repeat protein n=1 Tax=Candidatus Palauibacter sp. TaxID=3101350 RepID=UPI003B01C263
MKNFSHVAIGVAVLSFLVPPRALVAQATGRTILVAPVAVTDPIDGRLGERISQTIRDAFKDFPGFSAIERSAARNVINDFGLDERTMTPVDWRQLAGFMQASLVMVGTAVPIAGAVKVDIEFIEPTTGDKLPMAPFTVADDRSHEEAARQIMDQLERGVEYARSLAFCADYLATEQVQAAVNNCNHALSLNPESERAHYLRGRAHILNEAWADAVADLQRVVDNNPSDTEALESLAFANNQLEAHSMLASKVFAQLGGSSSVDKCQPGPWRSAQEARLALELVIQTESLLGGDLNEKARQHRRGLLALTLDDVFDSFLDVMDLARSATGELEEGFDAASALDADSFRRVSDATLDALDSAIRRELALADELALGLAGVADVIERFSRRAKISVAVSDLPAEAAGRLNTAYPNDSTYTAAEVQTVAEQCLVPNP